MGAGVDVADPGLPCSVWSDALGSVWSDALGIANLLDGSDEVIYFKDRESRFLRVSKGCAELHRLAPADMVGLTDADLFTPEHAEAARADEVAIVESGHPMLDKVECERWYGRPDTWVTSSKFALRSADGTVVGTFGISRDVTSRVLAQQELARVETQLRTVLAASADQISMYDTELRYRYVNPAGERALGLVAAQVLGRTDAELGMPDAVLDTVVPAVQRSLHTGEDARIEFAVVGGAGSHWYQAHLNPDRDADGAVVGVIVSTRDITALKVAEQELAHRATHDSLTGLANRGLVVERAAQHLGDGTGRLGVLFVDVDDFKQINDLYGHEVGDHVLVEIADRLRALARRGDTVARLGGDEFVMLCQDVPDDVALEHLTCRVSSALAEPIVTDGLVLPLAVSVGGAVAGVGGATTTDLLARADAAMYRVKREHHARVDCAG